MINFEMLWKYQETDSEVEQLKKELDNTPERQKLRKLRRVLVEQSDKIKGFESGLKEKEAAIESAVRELESLLRDYDLEQDDLNIMVEDEECTAEELTESRKSMEALLDRINSLKKSLAADLEWAKKIETEVKETYAKGSKVKRDYEAAKLVVDTEKLEQKPNIDKKEKELELIARHLTPEIVKRYQTLKKKFPNPVVTLSGNRCTGCLMNVSMTTVRKFTAGAELTECENCGRIIAPKQD